MAQKREKEVTELKVPFICSPSLPSADDSRSPDATFDPSARSKHTSTNSQDVPDPVLYPPADQKRREVNRCSGCRRKVGLTGFRCRCGDLFCTEHRYSDRHDCNFDYKTAGRAAIARDNPVVRPAKILKV